MPMVDPQFDGEELFDDDIIEIFIEEAEEVVETINSLYPDWHSDPGNKECLEEIRRAFHTIKGSGRMVQADQISNLAKAMEDVLEKSISGSIMINSGLIDLVDRVRAVVPSMIESFKRREAVAEELDIDNLIRQAEALGRGEAVEMAKSFESNLSPEMAALGSLSEPPPVLNLDEIDSYGSSGGIDFISPLDWEEFKERLGSIGEAVEELSLSFSTLKDEVEVLKANAADSQNSLSASSEVGNRIEVFDKELQDLKYFLKASTQKLTAEFNELSDQTVERVNQQLEGFDIKSDKLQQELYNSRSIIDSTQLKIIGWSVGSAIVSCGVAIAAIYFLIV